VKKFKNRKFIGTLKKFKGLYCKNSYLQNFIISRSGGNSTLSIETVWQRIQSCQLFREVQYRVPHHPRHGDEKAWWESPITITGSIIRKMSVPGTQMLPHIEHIHDGVLDIHQRAGAFLKVNGSWLAGISQTCSDKHQSLQSYADREKPLHDTIFLFDHTTFTKSQTVLLFRIGFNADSDPAFYLNADPDPGSRPMRIQADPDPLH
jgi:hypothetical protein